MAIKCPAKNWDFVRRVTAENLAAGDYVLCDLGYGPADDRFIKNARRLLDENPKMGIVDAQHAIVIRKGVVDKWVSSDGKSYSLQHAASMGFKGYTVERWPELECKALNVH